MSKQCSICKKVLNESDFNRKSASKDGLDSKCKYCQKEYDKSRSAQKKIYDKKYKQEHKEQIKNYDKQHPRLEYKRQYSKIYHEEHKEQAKEYSKCYQENNKIKEKQRYAKYHLTHYNIDLKYTIDHKVMSTIYASLKSNFHDTIYNKYLNYNMVTLKEHLEKQFTSEMSWDNYGSYWELDHIIPKSQFNYSSVDDKEFQLCWSLSNLRPLSKTENRQRPKKRFDII